MGYLLINTETNVTELYFELEVSASPPMITFEVSDEEYKFDMLNSIFIDINNYKPYPRSHRNSVEEDRWAYKGYREDWWASNGTDWVDTRDDDRVSDIMRKIRNNALLLSDWTQLADAPVTPPQQAEWAAYRTKLRNAPNDFSNNPHKAEALVKKIIVDNKSTIVSRKV